MYLFIWWHQVLVACGTWIFQLLHTGFQLQHAGFQWQHVGSSSWTKKQTQVPCTESSESQFSHQSITEVPPAPSSFLSSICARKGLSLSSQPRFPLKDWEPNSSDFLLFFLVSFPLLFLSVYIYMIIYKY